MPMSYTSTDISINEIAEAIAKRLGRNYFVKNEGNFIRIKDSIRSNKDNAASGQVIHMEYSNDGGIGIYFSQKGYEIVVENELRDKRLAYFYKREINGLNYFKIYPSFDDIIKDNFTERERNKLLFVQHMFEKGILKS